MALSNKAEAHSTFLQCAVNAVNKFESTSLGSVSTQAYAVVGDYVWLGWVIVGSKVCMSICMYMCDYMSMYSLLTANNFL